MLYHAPIRRSIVALLLACSLPLLTVIASGQTPNFSSVPGTVISHSPKSSNKYIGSPSITILPNGDFVAAHDFFGPASSETSNPITQVFRSTDDGQTWTFASSMSGQFWSSLFVHNEELYILGASKNIGDLRIRKSTDGGLTWTVPTNATNGVVRAGSYGSAPNHVEIHDGKVWIAAQFQSSPVALSAPVGANLLHAASWTVSNVLPRDPNWFDGEFIRWTEAQTVASPELGVVLLPKIGELPYTALIRANSATGQVTFNDQTDFIPLPGGEKKFGARHDPVSGKFFAASNIVLPAHANDDAPSQIRNTAALLSSTDLRDWNVEGLFLYAPNSATQAFQYLDFEFDGDDLAVVSRTAYDDGVGGPNSNHNSNLMTFHKIEDFRDLAPTHVLVADTNNNRVMRYEVTQANSWAPLAKFTLGNVFGQAPLQKPMGLAQDAQGNVYIGEQQDGGRILRFDAAGNFLNVVATEGVDFAGHPEALTVGPDGKLYVSAAFGSGSSDKIYRIDLANDSTTLWINTNFAGGNLNNPRGIAFDDNGRFYVADRENNQVRVFNATSGALMSNLIGLSRPQGIAWDGANQQLVISNGTTADLSIVQTNGASANLYNTDNIGSALGIVTIDGVAYWTDFTNGRVYQSTGANQKVTNVSGLNGPGHLLAVEQPAPGLRTWTAGGSADWHDPTNWYYWGRPDSPAETAVFGSAATTASIVTLDEQFAVNGLQFRNVNSYTITGTGELELKLEAGSATVDVARGAHVVDVPVTLGSAAQLTLAENTQLSFNDELHLAGSTMIVSGSGTLKINHSLQMGGGMLIVTGESPVEFGDGLIAQLDGSLKLQLPSGQSVGVGDTLQLLAFTSLAATFNAVLLPQLAPELTWDVSMLYLTGVVSVDPHLPGDYNQDGVVDAADYVVWRETEGQMGMQLAADGNNDGRVDAHDYGMWRANFGRTGTSGSGSEAQMVIPEPASVLVLITIAGFVGRHGIGRRVVGRDRQRAAVERPKMIRTDHVWRDRFFSGIV
jgi:hypothetical protein